MNPELFENLEQLDTATLIERRAQLLRKPRAGLSWLEDFEIMQQIHTIEVQLAGRDDISNVF